MSKVLKSKHGTYLTDQELEYRKELIAYDVVCPITKDLLSIYEGEIIICNEEDYFISDLGIDKLIGIFGEKFITERIITYD